MTEKKVTEEKARKEGDVIDEVIDTAHRVAKKGVKVVGKGLERGAEVAEELIEEGAKVTKKAIRKGRKLLEEE